jgi:hypothetical protein
MMGDLHFHRGYSLRHKKSKPCEIMELSVMESADEHYMDITTCQQPSSPDKKAACHGATPGRDVAGSARVKSSHDNTISQTRTPMAHRVGRGYRVPGMMHLARVEGADKASQNVSKRE